MDVHRLLERLAEAGHDSRMVSGETQILVRHDACGDTKGHLYVSAEHGAWICHHCGMSGNLADVLNELCDMPPFEAWEEARRIRYGDGGWEAGQGAPHTPKPRAMQAVRLPKEFIPDDGTGLAGQYLARRGIDPDLCLEYGIGYCLSGEYSYRIIVPVYTCGELRTFVARSWVEAKPKVLTARGSQVSEALFNIDNIRPPAVVLVEGVFDALRLPLVAAATLGTVSSLEQRNILRDLGFREIVLLRDGDEAGRRAARREAFELSAQMFDVWIATLPTGVDPGSATDDQLLAALSMARKVDVDYSYHAIDPALDKLDKTV